MCIHKRKKQLWAKEYRKEEQKEEGKRKQSIYTTTEMNKKTTTVQLRIRSCSKETEIFLL